MTTFVNLTPHILNIIDVNNNIMDIPPSGKIARVSSTSAIVATINNVNVTQQTFGDVIDLPDAQDDIVYIVSRMVKDRVAHRSDVLVPGASVRDADGKVIGANGLSL
jgi:hypothetical protein